LVRERELGCLLLSLLGLSSDLFHLFGVLTLSLPAVSLTPMVLSVELSALFWLEEVALALYLAVRILG
jgi:hypothetical protein